MVRGRKRCPVRSQGPERLTGGKGDPASLFCSYAVNSSGPGCVGSPSPRQAFAVSRLPAPQSVLLPGGLAGRFLSGLAQVRCVGSSVYFFFPIYCKIKLSPGPASSRCSL